MGVVLVWAMNLRRILGSEKNDTKEVRDGMERHSFDPASGVAVLSIAVGFGGVAGIGLEENRHSSAQAVLLWHGAARLERGVGGGQCVVHVISGQGLHWLLQRGATDYLGAVVVAAVHRGRGIECVGFSDRDCTAQTASAQTLRQG